MQGTEPRSSLSLTPGPPGEEEGAGGTEGYVTTHQCVWNKPGDGSQSCRKWNRVLKHPAELVHVWGWVSHSDSEATAKPKGQRTLLPPAAPKAPSRDPTTQETDAAPGAAQVTGPWGGDAGTLLKAPASTFHSLLSGWREMGPSDLPKGKYPSPPGSRFHQRASGGSDSLSEAPRHCRVPPLPCRSGSLVPSANGPGIGSWLRD